MVQKKPIKIWYVSDGNIVISKLVETKTNSKYLIGYLDKVIRPLVLIMTKMSGYVKTFKVKVIATDMRYFARSKFVGSLVQKKIFGLI